MFLEILQNPQENKYAGLSFLIKWQVYSLQTLSKNDTLAHVPYCEICEEFFKNTHFVEHFRPMAFEDCHKYNLSNSMATYFPVKFAK